MNKSDEKNYLSLTHFFSKALFLGIGIAKIIMDAKTNAIYSLLLGTILGSILLHNMNNIKKIIMFILIYILFIIGINELTNLITSIYLIDSNNFFVMLPLIIVILYINTKNITINIKIAHILLFLFNAFFIICFLSLIPEIDTLNYLPLFNLNIKNILFTSIEFALFSVTPNILYGGIKYNKNINNKIIKNYIISNIVIILMILTTTGVLGYELVNLFKYPEYVVLKKISLLDFINNIENILSFCIIFALFIFLSICSKELYDISENTFNNKYIYPIFLIISLYFISITLFDNIIFFILTSKYLWLICLIILIIYILTNINTLFNKQKK